MKIQQRLHLLSAAAIIGAASLTSPFSTASYAQGSIIAQTQEASSIYGLAARLPKDTEGFASLYRLADLWEGFISSNAVKSILANEDLVKELDLDDMKKEYGRDEEFRLAVDIGTALAGTEMTIALPAGFTQEISKILKNLPTFQAAFLGVRTRAAGGGDDEAPGMPPEILPLIEKASEMNIPPVILAARAGAAKEKIQALIAKGLISARNSDAAKKITLGGFSQDGIEFQSITFVVGKMMDEDDKEKMVKDLKRAAKDDAKGEALAKKLQAKTAELAWGWMDDYLIVSIGSGHGHVKFASAADGLLTHPDLAPRAAAWAAKKPFGLTYTSKETFRQMNELGSVVESLAPLAEVAKTAGVPVDVERILESLRKLSTKADAVFPNNPDAAAGALWWDGGLHAEAFGGNKPLWFDNSKPLTLASLATDKTLFLSQSRANEAHRDKVFGLFEEVVAGLYGIYQDQVKALLPDEAKQGAALGEAIGLPVVKQLWQSFQHFRSALGAERGVLVNLDGAIPKIPGGNVPEEVMEKGRIPRIAVIADLKDRAKLSEAWKGFKDSLGSIIALVASQTGADIKTTPVEKKEGAVSLYGFELPMDTGDVWPHTAVSETRWMFSTSPSFSKELAGKTATASGPALGHHTKLNTGVLWNYAADWLKLIPMNSEREAEEIQLVLKYARMIQGLELKLGEDAGQSHDKLELHITDLKD